ncbi:MAG: serine/threonine-protein kinase [Planctomycetota bacterium]|nr:serine/threonine-protein kinase [Planctomycetota bacterium]
MKHPGPDPAPRDNMTEEQLEHLLAEALEDYHRTKARGERPDDEAFRSRLGDAYGEFMELVAAETLIDQAIEPAGDESHLPLAWGAYTLLREIARGAAGVVYEAIHRKLGRKVALKVLRTGVDTDANARERFHREAKALAHVKHDHIVEIYEFGEIDGRPYYAMSLVDGPSLMQLEKSGKRPEPRDLCRGLAGVADALATLHAEGIIHRDVKPQNIIVGEDGRYMLADFGLARSAMSETMTQSGDALGTPLYMSPEQMLGDRKAIEARTDIYGLGASMYQLLTGVPPFKTDNLHALMRMILKERPVSPRRLLPELPKDCSDIALQCLEKARKDRYATAAALRDDLLAFAEDEPVRADPVGPVKRGLRLIGAHPALSAAAALLLGVGMWALLRPPSDVPLTLKSKVELVELEVKLEGVDGDYRPAADRVTYQVRPHQTYRAHVRAAEPGYEPEVETIEVGETGQTVQVVLIATQTSTLARKVGADLYREPLDLRKRESEKVHRGMTRASEDPPSFEPYLPRGPVAATHAGSWAVLLDGDLAVKDVYPKGAWLVFYVDGERIHAEPFPEPDDVSTRGRLPAAAAARLTPGVRCTWGLAGAKNAQPDERFRATFEVASAQVEKPLAPQLARIEALVAKTDADQQGPDRSAVGANLRAEAYFRAGLYASALAEIQPLLDADLEASFAAEDEGRELDQSTLRSSQYLIRLKELSILALFPSAKERLRTLVWNDLQMRDQTLFTTEEWEAFRLRQKK